MYQAVHYQFVACAKVKKWAKDFDDTLMIGTMVADSLADPYSYKEEDIELCDKRNHLQLYFYTLQMCNFGENIQVIF